MDVEMQVEKFQYLSNNIVDSHQMWKRYSSLIDENQPKPVLNRFDKNAKKETGFFASLFRREFSTDSASIDPIKGVYLYGGSGCGKTFLSNIFYDNLSIVEK